MGTTKKYEDAKVYELKLKAIMERLGIKDTDYNYNWDRHGAWIDFKKNGKYSRFEHSITNAKAHGENLAYGTDVFAQLVLALGDLERVMRRGIYTFDMFVRGLPMLEAPKPNSPLPQWAIDLKFTEMPATAGEVNERYRSLAKGMHPDAGGNVEGMQALNIARDQAIKWVEGL